MILSRFAILGLLQVALCARTGAAILGYTGDTIFSFPAGTGRNGLISISPDVSINDDGLLAFVATDAAGQGVFVADFANNAVTRISAQGTATYGSEVQINNAGQVGAVSISGGQRRARIYQSVTAPGGGVIIGSSSAPRATTSHFDGLVNFVSLSNDGQLLFSGLESPTTDPSFWEIHLSSTEVDRRDSLSPFSEVMEIVIPPAVFFRFAAAEGNRSVVAKRQDGKDEITWHDITGIDSSSLVASTENGLWTALGIRPGISDDGSVVAFSGTLTQAGANAINANQSDLAPMTAGQGVFIAHNTSGSWRYSRIAGISLNGILEPGESWVDYAPLGQVDATEDENGFSSFETDQRVSVAKLPDQTCRVSFVATGPFNWKGIYSGRFSDADNQIKATPTPIAVIGGEIAGLSLPVTDVRVNDALNRSNQIAFWAQTMNGTEVVRSKRLLDPHRQFHMPWGTNLYAANRLEDFITRLENGGPNIHPVDIAELDRLRAIRDRRAYNLARRGCLITSYAMALKQLELGDVTPGELNDRMAANNGITEIEYLTRNAANQVIIGSGGLPVFEGAEFTHGVLQTLYPRFRSVEVVGNIVQEVVDHLDRGLPALLNVRGGNHWILGTRLDDEGRLVLIDSGHTEYDGPYDADEATIEARFGQIEKARLLWLADAPSAVVQTFSPVDFVITSPSGQRLGFNPLTGVSYSEIPNSSYAVEWPIDDPETSYTDEQREEFRKSTPRLVFLNTVESGGYAVEVFGIGAGTYSLRFELVGSAEPISFRRDGTIALNQSITHQFAVSVVPPKLPPIAIELSANRDIRITIKGVPGKRYQLQFADSLMQPTTSWQSLGEPQTMAPGGQLQIVLSNEAVGNARFYRVIQLP